MTRPLVSITKLAIVVVVVLVNLWQMVHLRKHNSRICGPTVTADGVLFHGNDQIVLPNQQYNPENVSLVQFAFKTTSAEGLLLLYTGMESSAALQSLELVDGKLLFRLNFGPGSTVMISRERYNDGKWHDLEAKRTSDHLYMMLDGVVVTTALVPENINEAYDDSSVVYIGDFKETQHSSVTSKGFKGFLKNIRLGNVAVDLNSLIRKSSCHKRIRGRRDHEGPTMRTCYGVTDFRATYIGATNVELSWSSKYCDMEYEVETKQLGTNESLHNSTKDHHIEIKNLMSNVTYEFTLCGDHKVKSTTGYNSSLIVDKVTESTITISWEVFGKSSSESNFTVDLANCKTCSKIAIGTDNSYEFSELEPGSEYEVKLSDDVDSRTWSTRTIKTKGVFLDNFNCSSSEIEGTIDCSWGRGSGYDCGVNYQVNISESVYSPKIHHRRFSTSSLTELRAGQTYSISIQYFANNYSSKVMNDTAVAKTGISESFFNYGHHYSNQNITLRYFRDPHKEITNYVITLDGQSFELSLNNLTKLIDNLTAGHHYPASAYAVSNGVKSHLLETTVSTVPYPPLMVECIDVLNTSMTVKIEQPENGNFDDYEVFLNGESKSMRAKPLMYNVTINHMLDGLDPFKDYKVEVKYVMNFMKLSSLPKSRDCKTKDGIPDEVRHIKNTTFWRDGFKIHWSPPAFKKGIIIGYVIKVFDHKTYEKSKNHLSPLFSGITNETAWEVRDDDRLKQGHRYTISVAAKTSAGEGKAESIVLTLDISSTNHLLVAALVILAILLVVLIGLLGYYFIRKSPSRMQSVRRISSRLMNSNNEVRYFKQPAVSSKPVKISDFVTYLEKLEKDSGLKLTEEYEDLKFVGRNQSKDEAELQCNRVKNRFTNILPYDVSRVKLLAMEDEDGSDYINASWIPGFHSKREFIASQGPLPSTVDDFWRMIWENNCQAIVMLTLCIEKGHIKCEQYWPVQNEPVCYGDVKVEMQNEETNEEWHTREFKISMGSQSRKLIHFHYVTWPDMYVPQRMSLIAFVREIRANLNKNNGKGPIVVHCSAGVGRSGTFIALDTLLHQILAEHDLDVYGVVFQMRMNRVLMVQTEAQYAFIYECLKHILDEKNGLTVIEENAEPQNCREEVKKEEAEADPTSDSKEKQSQTGCAATESNLNSETKEKVQDKEPERNNDEAQDKSSSSIKEDSSPKENAEKSESKSKLNSDESSSKTDDGTRNLEISNQNLGDGKDNGR